MGYFPAGFFFSWQSTLFFFGGSKIARLDSPGLSEAAVQQTPWGEGAGVFYVAQSPGAQAPLRRAPRVCELRRGMVWRAAPKCRHSPAFGLCFVRLCFFPISLFLKNLKSIILVVEMRKTLKNIIIRGGVKIKK